MSSNILCKWCENPVAVVGDVCEVCAAAMAAHSAQPGRVSKVSLPPPRIDYLLSPECFRLEIPVECLASMNEHDITRMINMLTDWIHRHKPPRPVLGVPDTALQQQLRDKINAITTAKGVTP